MFIPNTWRFHRKKLVFIYFNILHSVKSISIRLYIGEIANLSKKETSMHLVNFIYFGTVLKKR